MRVFCYYNSIFIGKQQQSHYFVYLLQTFPYLLLFSQSVQIIISQSLWFLGKLEKFPLRAIAPAQTVACWQLHAVVVPIPPCISCTWHEKEIRPRRHLPLVVNLRWVWIVQTSRQPLGIHKFTCSINMCRHAFVRKGLPGWDLRKEGAVAELVWELCSDSSLLFPPTCSFHIQLTFLLQEQFRTSCIHASLFQAVRDPSVTAQ